MKRITWYQASGLLKEILRTPRWSLARLPATEWLFNRPRSLQRQFFAINETAADDHRPVAFVFGVRPRRASQLQRYLPDYRVYFVPEAIRPETLARHCRQLDPPPRFFVWGYRERAGIGALAEQFGTRLQRIEDGFILSRSLGARGDQSLSLLFDSRGVHFAGDRPTDLELMLLDHDFEGSPQLLADARRALGRIVAHRLSKYNYLPRVDAAQLYGPKRRPRVLVIGQSEKDASIAYGSPRIRFNNELVELAARENPGAEILYKIHPDVLAGHATAQSDPRRIARLCRILDMPLSVPDALETIDRVYVMTSLSGFEALMRGIEVTVTGMPFYAGWGLTDDRITLPRRNRQLTLEQLFAVSYLRYPVYRHPVGGQRISLDQTIDLLTTPAQQ